MFAILTVDGKRWGFPNHLLHEYEIENLTRAGSTVRAVMVANPERVFKFTPTRWPDLYA